MLLTGPSTPRTRRVSGRGLTTSQGVPTDTVCGRTPLGLIPLCVFGALFGLASPARAAIDDYIGRSIASVRLLIEGRETSDTALARAILTRVGQPLSMPAVRESITHLFSLGRFTDVQVDATAVEGNRVALRYELSPVHPVTKIEFAGGLDAPGVDTGRLRKALVDRYGASPSLGRTTELVTAVEAALSERGYLHSIVKSRAILAHRPDRATLVLTVDPGPRTLVGDIDVVGPPSVSRSDLLGRLGLAKGAAYQRSELDARVERYITERRKAGYYEAKLSVAARTTDDERTAHLTLTVTAGSHVRVLFTGDSLPADKRAELVPIESEGSVDEDLLEDSTNRIETYLRDQGYRMAKAPHTREELDGELRITFSVRRGPAYRVSRVEISGNASVPLSEFDAALRLRDGQPFTESKLEADVATIENLYHRRGFAGAKAQVAEEPQPVAANDGFMPLVVRIVVNEGPQTLVASIRVQGNASVPEPVLTRELGLQPGRPYFDAQLVLDRDAIQLHYVNLGYLGATVDVNPNLSGDRTRAELLFAVREGPRVFVEHILIVGNLRTSSEAVEHELQIKSGDPLSAEARVESQRRLMALGLFRRVQINELRTGDETIRDLLVTVEESPASTIAYGGGVEGRLRVVRSEENPGFATERLEFAPRGSFEIGQRNFFGKNRSVNLFTSVSLHPKDSPAFLDQSNTTPTGTGGFGFVEYRVLGQYREPKVFGASADALITGTIEQQIRSSFNFSRRGAAAEVARKVTREIGASVSYQIQRTRLFDVSVSESDRRLIDRLFPEVRLSSISSSVIHDTRNDQVEPGSGYYVSGNLQIAGRRIGSEVGFLKTYSRAQLFRTLPRARRTVLAGNLQLGLARGFLRETTTNGLTLTVEDLPASERFFAGGDTTIRGFALDTVGTPKTLQDGFPLGGNAMVILNAEARVPVLGGLGVVGFFDTGNVFARVADVDLTELRSAVGVGLRYRSPVGPLRLDVGFKVHPQEIAGRRERPWVVHISFGQAF